MKMYLKQKVFSWGDKFSVYDENGNDIYYVQGEVFTFGKKLHVYDLLGNEVCYIFQKLMSFRPRYFISKGEHVVAQVIKEISFFKSYYTVEGFDWTVEGDFLAHEYEIEGPSGTVAQIAKQWFTWGDAYYVETADTVNAVDALAVVLVIDACLQNEGSGVSVTFSGN